MAAAILAAIACLTPATALTDYSRGTSEYALDEYDVTVTAPENWMGFTWDVEENDENLKTLKTTREKLLNHFQENDIIFETAYPGKGTIDVAFRENNDTAQLYDLTYLTEPLLHVMGKAMADGEYEGEDSGFTYSKYNFYYYNDTQYIVLDFTKSRDGDKQGIVYYTISDGKEYRFVLTSEKGNVSDELRETLKTMIDNTTYFYGTDDWDDYEYNDNRDGHADNYPEEYHNSAESARAYGISIFIAIIIGFLVFAALVVLIVVLAVRNGSRKRTAMQGFEIRTGPDGRQYYYPVNGGMPQAGVNYQTPYQSTPVQPPLQEEKKEQQNPYDGHDK